MCYSFPGIADTIHEYISFDETIYTDGTVRVVRIYDSIVYVGGEFSKVYDKDGSHSRHGLAAINVSTRLVTAFKADINSGTVRSLTLANDMLYAGGTFTSVNNISRSKIVAVNPETGNVIETFSNTTANINGPVYAVAYLDKKLYVGGNFTNVNAIERNYMVALDAESGKVNTVINPSPSDSMDYDGKMNGGIFTLDVYKEDSLHSGILFVGGNYRTICGVNGKQFLVALNADGTLGPDFDKRITQAVDAMECKGSVLYVGYAGFGNRPAAYKITTETCVELWKGYVVNGDVQAVTCSDKGFLFFSFHQGLYDTTDLYRCAVIDASTGKPYDVLPPMSSFFGIFSLDSYKELLITGGTFRKIGDKNQNYLAIFKMPPYPLQHLPSKVILKGPVNDSFIDSRNVTLKWHFTCWADSFDIEIALDSLFTNLLETYSGVIGYDKKYSSLENATRYFWRVRGLNQWGEGEWSDYSHFTTVPGYNEIPQILIPADSTDSVETTFNCIWNSESKAESYKLQVSSYWSFDSLVLDTIIESDTSVLINGLLNNSKYYLRMKTKTIGGLSDWKIIEFTTVVKKLISPIVIFPQDGMNQIATTTLLMWKLDKESERYNLRFSTDSTFHNLIYDIKNLTDTIFRLNGLGPNTSYFWRLQSLSWSGQSDWSKIWRFVTMPDSENIPVIISPENNTVIQFLPVVCKWHRNPDASSYTIRISRESDFNTGMIVESDLKDTSFLINNLENKKSYYIKVRALLSGGPSEWAYCRFSTISKLPQRPLLLKPADKKDQVELNPEFKWSYDENTKVYNIQLSTEETFSNLLMDSTARDTFCKVNSLNVETQYFYRVRAINEAGEAWSSPVTFTTMYSLPNNPVPLYPCSPVQVPTDSVVFLWSCSQPHVSQYRMEIAYDSLMNDMMFSATTPDTTYLLTGFRDHSKLFWRVQAINRSGAGIVSPTAVFTTSFPPINCFALQKFVQADNKQAISYSIGMLSDIRISLFNLRGICIWEYKSSNELPGSYLKNIDTRLYPGKYILRFRAGNYRENRDVIILQ
jgi:hypothetical protein